jgi:hypothetical protein
MEWKAPAYRCTSNLWRLSCPPAAAVLSVAAASCAPLAELAARERPVELAVELLRLKRFAKELEPMLCGEAYLVVAPRDHDDWKSKVFRMTSKRRAVLSRRYGIEDDRINVVSPQGIAR